MSARVTAWVWDSPVDDMAECMVLLALAGQANDDGDVLTVSLTRLARQCRMGQETLRRALDGLEERGFLTARTRPSQWCWSGRINLEVGSMSESELTCSGMTPTGQTCGARMRLCSSRSGKIMPFFRAETSHALGCDEGAWNVGPEVVAAFDALRDGHVHPTAQWLEALDTYLQAGSPNHRDMNSYLGQWSEGQWQAWADYRNALATGSTYEAPCIPAGLSKLLGFPIMPADMTAPFPYLGFICCGVQELFEADKQFGNRLTVSNTLFKGPTLHDLAQAQQRLKPLSEDANWWLEVTVLLLPQPNGKGVLAEVSEVLLAVNTDSEPALADVNLDGLFPQTAAQTYTCCGTHAWRWE